MRQIKKRLRLIVLGICLMFTFVSVTAFATGNTELSKDGTSLVTEDPVDPVDPENPTDPEDPVDPVDPPELINLEDHYVIEFDEPNLEMYYSGAAFTPEFKVYPLDTEEVPDIDDISEEETGVLTSDCYTIAYANNVDAGTASVTVTGIEEKGYTGKIFAEFNILPAPINEAELTINKTTFTYNGKAQNPVEKLMLNDKVLKKDVDYTVSYTGNKEVGTATVIVTAKDNYTGSLKANYKINLATPSISSVINYNQVKVNWKKITGASGYEVARSTSKSSGYKTIKSITSGSTVSYTDKSVKLNTTYYYKVRAYRTVNGKKVYSAWSGINTSKVKPGTPAISKISRSSTTSLKVAWNKISGASGYEVYRSTSEKGKYTKITTIKKNGTVSYTDTKRSCGKTYYYKVRAYRTVNGKKYYSSYSAVKAQNTVPGKVSWDKSNITYNATSVTLKWKKVSEATGYCIYRSTEKYSGYKKIKVLNKNTTLTWKDTGLKKGVVYYYKICSYKNMGKYAVYGSYSDTYTKNVAGWKYKTYDGKKVKLYYNSSGKLVKDVSSIIGKQSSYQIRINKRKNTVTVYAKDGKNGYIIPVKAFVCSTGAATPLGTFKTPQKIRWHELDGPTYGQWCTRITGHILFHSVWYYKPKNTTLSTVQYNRLGTQASHGCVRLTAGDAKWIYDNCKLGTTVKIYNSSKEGPLGKPSAKKLKSWHTWDPTDPNMKKKCKSKGCH